MAKDEFLLTAEELATKLNVHVETVRRLTRDGQIPHHRVGDARYRLSDVLAATQDGSVLSAD